MENYTLHIFDFFFNLIELYQELSLKKADSILSIIIPKRFPILFLLRYGMS